MSTTTETTPQGAAAENLTVYKPRITHVAYHVADIERALRFYVGVLGLKELMRIPLGQGLQEVVLNFPNDKGAGVILMWNDSQTAQRQLGDGYSRFVMNVSDVDAAFAQLVKHNAPVVTPVTTYGAMKFAMVKDPDGYIVEILQFLQK